MLTSFRSNPLTLHLACSRLLVYELPHAAAAAAAAAADNDDDRYDDNCSSNSDD